MKKSLLLLLFVSFLITSCINWGADEDTPPQNEYTPITIDRETFEGSVHGTPQRNIVKSGKIYIKDNLMFVNDVNKGFHIYDYANPENPIRIGFIEIVGATDLAVRNNIIYINQAVDLVSLTYNPANNAVSVLNRNRNVFPQKRAPNGQGANTDDDKIIVDWILD